MFRYLLDRTYRMMRVRQGVLRARKQMGETYNAEHLAVLDSMYGGSPATDKVMRKVADRKQAMLEEKFLTLGSAVMGAVFDKAEEKK